MYYATSISVLLLLLLLRCPKFSLHLSRTSCLRIIDVASPHALNMLGRCFNKITHKAHDVVTALPVLRRRRNQPLAEMSKDSNPCQSIERLAMHGTCSGRPLIIITLIEPSPSGCRG
ncbi:hypothetical protein BDV09DRAFT_108755 [Aspergillus tetrazonus]